METHSHDIQHGDTAREPIPRTTPDHHVPRRGMMTTQAFLREHLHPLRPVILTDAIAHWPALTKWTPEFFRERYRGRPLMIDGQHYTMSIFLDLVLHSRPEHPAPYLRNRRLRDEFPELLPDVSPLPRFTAPNWFESRLFPSKRSLTYHELYIGGTGASFPILHYDNWHTHVFLMQIYGTKCYIMYAPEQTPFLYPHDKGPRNKSRITDIAHVDLQQFPLFAQAQPVQCLLQPGETLFVPAGWWHTARIDSPSITVSANTVNSVNWPQFLQDYYETITQRKSLAWSRALKAYLKLLGFLGPVLGLL